MRIRYGKWIKRKVSRKWIRIMGYNVQNTSAIVKVEAKQDKFEHHLLHEM